jgi:hypothetical protein
MMVMSSERSVAKNSQNVVIKQNAAMEMYSNRGLA